MSKIFRLPLTFILIAALVSFTSCDDHDDEPHDEEGELITTVTLTMTPQGGGTPITATYRDLDGDGGNAPVMTPAIVVLKAGVTYTTTIRVLDEANNEDLTAEIKQEGHEHEFFFVPSPATLMTVTKTDKDRNNRPVGLENTLQTSSTAQSGSLRVVLKHQPGGLKTNNSTISTGETDADVTYAIRLE
ncbi:hypothetical protein H9Q13_08870 [Pontibacter sp. JH31]|uniref:Type 1 periplasmic binding fold superfamily protein n=1 Tax=Pontibacter aquaedesilientis TaxID=2766980 RepID=A0ABR7XG40_9BACT|nr:hypothetical protein [Pontibacter aquaedesilientis]MBD1397274.1 hypothetical protein [Pontibacter aquaedesilientis]